MEIWQKANLEKWKSRKIKIEENGNQEKSKLEKLDIKK